VANKKGFDISHWNGTVFWIDVPDEYCWCYIKSTESDDFQDELFPQHWLGAYQENKLRSPYHFWRYAKTPKENVDNYYSYVREQGLGLGELPPILDVEDVYAPKSPWVLYEHILECLQRIEDSFQVEPWIYSAAWYWDEWVKTTRLRNYGLIVANYKTLLYPGIKPRMPKTGGWTEYKAWQHTDKAKIPGILGGSDGNIMPEEVFNEYSNPGPPPTTKIVKVLIPDGVEVIVEKI